MTRTAILSNSDPGVSLIQAQGLKRMCDQIGVKADLYNRAFGLMGRFSWRRNFFKQTLRALQQPGFYRRLSQYDCIIVCINLPLAFMRHCLPNIENILRRRLPHVPIVNYDNKYLPNCDHWLTWLKNGSLEHGIPVGGQFGMERFDWYLAGSLGSVEPGSIPDHPVHRIGINLDDGTLSAPPQKETFLALIDFARPGYESFRSLQIQALERTGIPYLQLHGSHSIEEIRKIYRQCSLYFPAFPESFGLPICELQACGAMIFVPYSDWVPSHHLASTRTNDHDQAGLLNENFIQYGTDLDKLCARLNEIRNVYNAQIALNRFITTQPWLYYGDTRALSAFFDLVSNKTIHGQSHLKYHSIKTLAEHNG